MIIIMIVNENLLIAVITIITSVYYSYDYYFYHYCYSYHYIYLQKHLHRAVASPVSWNRDRPGPCGAGFSAIENRSASLPVAALHETFDKSWLARN